METHQLKATGGAAGELEEIGDEGGGEREGMMGEGDKGEHIEQVVAGATKEEDRVYRPGVWTLKESIVLLEAKKREKEILTGSKRNSVSADEKWRAVAEYCWSRGVQRSKEQCRFKWENTMPDFKKVRDYEDDRGDNDKSYFEMESWQRKQLSLPPNLNRDLYGIMDKLLLRRPSKQAGSGSTKKESRGKEVVQQDETAVLEAAVSTLPSGEEFPSEIPRRDSVVPRDIASLVGTEVSQGEMVGERSASGAQTATRQKDMPTPDVKGSARKRRKKTSETRELESGFGAPVEHRTSVEIGSASTPLPGFRELDTTATDTARADVRSGSVLISEVPSQGPGVQLVRLEASRELPFKQMGQQHQGRSEAGDTSSPVKGQKKVGPSSTEPAAEINTTTAEAQKSADYLMRTEEKKDARYGQPHLQCNLLSFPFRVVPFKLMLVTEPPCKVLCYLISLPFSPYQL